jgi:hypothetical protein
MIKTSRPMAALLIAALLSITFPAHASIVGTEEMIRYDTRAASLSTVYNALASEEVVAQLAAWGVSPEAAAERVAALSTVELQELADSIDTDPAGGLLVALGVVFLVLLILELTGVINIFR